MRNGDGWIIGLGIVAMLAFYKGLEFLLAALTAASFPSPIHYYTALSVVGLTLIVQLTVGQAIKRVPQAFFVLGLAVLAMGFAFRGGNAIGKVFESGKYEWATLASAFSLKGDLSVLGMLGGGFFAVAIAWSAFTGVFKVLFGRRPRLPFTGERHIRGRGLISYEKAKAMADSMIQHATRPPYFGMMHIPEEASTKHFLFVGGTGSGKTLNIRMLMESVLPIEDSRDTRALIYDAKQDMISILEGMRLKCPIHILNPFDARCSAWDMAADIKAPSSAEQVATILIPEEKNSSSPFFTDAARALLAGTIVALMRTAPGDWQFRDVLYALRNAERLKGLLSRCRETEDLVPQYFSNERTANDVISTVATKIQRYTYIAAAWSKAKSKLSLTQWIESDSVLLLGNDEMVRSALDAVNQVIFKRLTELVLAQSESNSRRTWFFLDELRQAGRLPGLNSLLTMGRSKGACVVVGFQDLEGLASVYGEKEASEIAGLCANKAILRLDSPNTARWAASVFGEREVLEVRSSSGSSTGTSSSLGGQSTDTKGEQSSVSEQVSKREVILASEFMEIGPTDFANGMKGAYLVPGIGSFWVKVGGENLQRLVRPASMVAQNYARRGAEDEVLKPWGKEDFARLRIPVEKGDPSASLKLELEDPAPPENSSAEPDTKKDEGEANYEKMMQLFKSGGEKS